MAISPNLCVTHGLCHLVGLIFKALLVVGRLVSQQRNSMSDKLEKYLGGSAVTRPQPLSHPRGRRQPERYLTRYRGYSSMTEYLLARHF